MVYLTNILGNSCLTRTRITSKHHVHGWHLVVQSLGCPYTVQFDKGRMIQNLLFDIIQANQRFQLLDGLLRISMSDCRQVLRHYCYQVQLFWRQA